jgi:hypothetical protein
MSQDQLLQELKQMLHDYENPPKPSISQQLEYLKQHQTVIKQHATSHNDTPAHNIEGISEEAAEAYERLYWRGITEPRPGDVCLELGYWGRVSRGLDAAIALVERMGGYK